MSRMWALLERAEAPDVNNPAENYMVRWRLIQTPWFGIYLHRLNKPDPRPTLHDHPWPFVSVILHGGYTEDFGVSAGGRAAVHSRVRRSWRTGSVHRMRSSDAHTITELQRSPTWTFVVAGRRQPEPSWGYADGDGWTPHDQHDHDAEFAIALASRRASPRSVAGDRGGGP
jgi:hypothetical protein